MPASTILAVTAAGFEFEQEAEFRPEVAREVVRAIPELPGVVCLYGHGDGDRPYLTRTANLRRRVARLLDPPEVVGQDGLPAASKRLNLRDRVARVAWSVTGSEFESLLVLYDSTAAIFGHVEARRRLKLRTPYFVRLTTEHAHPRVYVTNRLSRRGLGQMYGPFASRMAAERYVEAVLDLFKLRRCYEDLEVFPEHPGCAYGEMKKCMAPCNTSCSAEESAAEAQAVRSFFDTHGESLLAEVARERERASDEMDFERAAALHRQWEKVKSAAALADDLVRPVPEVRAVVVQRAALSGGDDGEQAGVFLLDAGRIVGPARLSTLGVRAVREQTSVGSSLFAQPLMLAAVPLGGQPGEGLVEAAVSPEARAAGVLADLKLRTEALAEGDLALVSDHLSLFRRWYYRPEKQRAGEVFLPNADGSWPLRPILRGAARAVLGDPKAMAETDREAARTIRAEARTKVLHEGRPEVERVVPVIEVPGTFRSRRRKALAEKRVVP